MLRSTWVIPLLDVAVRRVLVQLFEGAARTKPLLPLLVMLAP